MTEASQHIVNTVLKLPASKRTDVVDELLARVHEPADPAVEAAWVVEITRRAERALSGLSIARDSEDVEAELEAKYRRK